MKGICLCVVIFLTVGTVEAVTVNGDCSKDGCDGGLTCQNNVCKKKVGAACSGAECVANAQCSASTCVCSSLGFVSSNNGEQCAKPVHTRCTQTSECVKNAECEWVTATGTTTRQCQCLPGYRWNVNQMTCNAGTSLAASLLLLAAIFVMSRLV